MNDIRETMDYVADMILRHEKEPLDIPDDVRAEHEAIGDRRFKNV